jgi:tetratricopeptide (TPR) repeat protein
MPDISYVKRGILALDSEIRLTLQRIENALQNVMELRDFRNFMLAKAYLEEGQIQTAIQFLNRIDRNSDYNAQLVISQSLFIRALILVYDLQFTDALALLVRIRGMKNIEKDDQLKEDITKLIRDIKIHQQAKVIYDTAEDNPQIRDFKKDTLQNLENYLLQARSLLKKG